jgi:hypothetical protein
MSRAVSWRRGILPRYLFSQSSSSHSDFDSVFGLSELRLVSRYSFASAEYEAIRRWRAALRARRIDASSATVGHPSVVHTRRGRARSYSLNAFSAGLTPSLQSKWGIDDLASTIPQFIPPPRLSCPRKAADDPRVRSRGKCLFSRL